MEVLKILGQNRRNAHAAKRFLTRLIRRWGLARVLGTDKLRSYGVAARDLCSIVDHRSHKGLRNRSEASRRDTRRREKVMGRVKPPRFYPSTTRLPPSFAPKRHRLPAASYGHARADAFSLWVDYAAEMTA